jgi:hypothetical protein
MLSRHRCVGGTGKRQAPDAVLGSPNSTSLACRRPGRHHEAVVVVRELKALAARGAGPPSTSHDRGPADLGRQATICLDFGGNPQTRLTGPDPSAEPLRQTDQPGLAWLVS